MWPDRTLLDLFAIEIPILQAPMAGASDAELAIAVAKAGGLGALPAGMLSGEQIQKCPIRPHGLLPLLHR